MADLDKMKLVTIGLHSSATSFSDTPTFTSLEPDVAGVMPPSTQRLERDLYRADNQDYAALVGPLMLDEIVIDLLARGLAGAVGGSGGTIARLTASELGILFDSIFGTGTDPASTGSTVSADTGASSILNVTSGTNYANGGGVLFQTPTEHFVAREQVSKSVNALTLDRTWVDGAPGTDTVAYRSCFWTVDPTLVQHTHVGIRGKSSNWERTFLGCGIQSMSISGEEGKPVKVQTKWKPTDWSDTTVAPSFSAPSAGDYIVSTNSRLYIGNETFMFKKWSIDLGYTVSPRVTSSGPNGINGYLVTRKSPTFKGMCYFGSGGAGPTSFGEITDSSGNISLNKLQGLTNSSGSAITQGQAASTYDCALQIGNNPGSCLYVRIPAAELDAKLAIDAGVEMIDFSGKARRPASGTPMRLHLY